MIVIIGLVPEGVGNALASPIQTPGVSCSSPRGSATERLRVGAHPAGAHLVGAEQPVAAGAERDPLRAGRRSASKSSPRRHVGAPAASATIVWAPAASCRRTWTSIPLRRFSTSRSSLTEYSGIASPFASTTTLPWPRSRVSEMKVAPKRKFCIRSLWSAAEVHGVAEPIRPGAYCPVSIRIP